MAKVNTWYKYWPMATKVVSAAVETRLVYDDEFDEETFLHSVDNRREKWREQYHLNKKTKTYGGPGSGNPVGSVDTDKVVKVMGIKDEDDPRWESVINCAEPCKESHYRQYERCKAAQAAFVPKNRRKGNGQ
jgi:hypothetical protein